MSVGYRNNNGTISQHDTCPGAGTVGGVPYMNLRRACGDSLESQTMSRLTVPFDCQAKCRRGEAFQIDTVG